MFAVLHRLVAVIVDMLLVAALAAVAVCLVTGGTSLAVLGVRVGLRSVENPLVWTSVLCLLRVALPGRAPFLGVAYLEDPLQSIETSAERVVIRLRTMEPGRAWLIVATVATACAAVKLGFA